RNIRLKIEVNHVAEQEEPFSWPRPKTVRLRRTSQGFGFTLRHFIVYPPESTAHCFPGNGGGRGGQWNRLEPMDTIFVKQVKEGGPGHGAGLCTGDRIVKVNGASIIGKAYCEVISLIQDSGDFLELCVMPKDEDILQLAYSQDAYLRCRSSYSGNACHIPEPPPKCYPRVDCKPTGMAQATDAAGQVCRGPTAPPDHGYRKEISVPPSPPPQPYLKSQTAACMRGDGVRTMVVLPDSGQIGRMGPTHRMDFMDPVFVRGRPGSLAQYPLPRKADVYPAMVQYGGMPPHYPGNNQNIDWRTYQTYREYIDNKGIHSHGSRTIQERLDNLRASSQAAFATGYHIPRGDCGPKGLRRRSISHERSCQGPPPHFHIAPRSASQDRMSGAERMGQSRNWPPRSVSQDGLTHKARAHSTDYVDPAELARPNERRAGYARADQGTRPRTQHGEKEQKYIWCTCEKSCISFWADNDSSPPRDRAAWKIGIAGIMRKPFEKKTPAGVTFGVRLDDCPPAQTNRFVPLIVEVCCKVVEERGLEYTGIYRVPGNNAAISSMQEELNSKGMTDIDVEEDKWRDLNVISSLLKSFFRKLPDPLFTNEKYGDFIEASRTEDSVERLKELKRLIEELPDYHFETLKFLCAHLKKVSDNCEKNKMEPRNLAIVFGPTLVRTSEDNMTNMVNHMPDQCKIVENLIQQHDWFFTDDGDEDPITTAEQESTVHSQPVPNIDHLLSNIGRTTASPGEVSDSACSDSSKSKGLWGSGKDQCSKEMLRSSFFASRKRKKPKDKAHPSSSDDDLDAVFPKKELAEESQPRPAWSPDHRTRSEGHTDKTAEKVKHRLGSEKLPDKPKRKESLSCSMISQPSPCRPPEQLSSPPGRGSPDASPARSPDLGYRLPMAHQYSPSDPPSAYDDTVSDLGTMNSTSSQASVPEARREKAAAAAAAAPEACPGGPGAEVCSITSDYSTTSSMTFLTGAELGTLSPEVQSVAESRGGDDDADDERSELVSEGRPMETDSESDLSVFTAGKAEPGAPRPLPTYRLIEGDTLSRKKAAQQKTASESSLDAAAWCDKDPKRLSRASGCAAGVSTGSLGSSSRGELDKAEPAWKLKITDRLKVRLRTSVDDMFGVGSQRSRSPEGRGKKKNIRRRHTMGGQRDFAELSVLGDWSQHIGSASRSELSAVDQLKPKCSSQDFSIRDWIVRERHRTSNPEVSLEPSEQQGAQCGAHGHGLGASSSSELRRRSADVLSGDAPQGKNLSLSATAHPHKLTNSQVVNSRFYQCL
uniref:Rho GTPase activating protein 21b n=1 Tax=Gasterosteus aculeatus aculeatus TaxID=481459 RepID=A0AAQ4QTA0_GASAC